MNITSRKRVCLKTEAEAGRKNGLLHHTLSEFWKADNARKANLPHVELGIMAYWTAYKTAAGI